MGHTASDDERGATPFVPASTSLSTLIQAALGCRGCPLWQPATQTVFGQGRRSSAFFLVGEQPGDREDQAGHPFVGPAGGVLWSCVDEAGIARDEIYATNAVKHFKHEVRGKRRLHKKPNSAEIDACHPWIEAELRAVGPSVVVLLGATAARSVLGRPTSVGSSRGERFVVQGLSTLVTYHPSAVLRADDRATEIRSALVEDLRLAARWSQP